MNEWNKKERPLCLEKRFEFDSYNQTRDFLDRLGEHSERVNRFPDISFGKTYVNITLRPSEEAETQITKEDLDFAFQIDQLVS